MSSRRWIAVENLPVDCVIETYADNTAWLVKPSGERMTLRGYVEESRQALGDDAQMMGNRPVISCGLEAVRPVSSRCRFGLHKWQWTRLHGAGAGTYFDARCLRCPAVRQAGVGADDLRNQEAPRGRLAHATQGGNRAAAAAGPVAGGTEWRRKWLILTG